jgi:hypothetical protein
MAPLSDDHHHHGGGMVMMMIKAVKVSMIIMIMAIDL